MTTSTASDISHDVLMQIEDYFLKTVPAAAPKPLTADTPLLGTGLLDSLSMLELTMFLSETFGIEFDDDDFVADNFKTAGSLVALVAGKRAAAA